MSVADKSTNDVWPRGENVKENNHKNNNDIKKDISKDYAIDKLKDSLKDYKEMNNYLKVNNKLENMELLDYIDSGGESVIYGVFLINPKKRELKKKCIMKVVLSDKINTNEIQISSKLKHNNIINFYGYTPLKENESSLLLIEQAKYNNLRNFQLNYLKKRYLSESFINYVAYQILKGLEYMHRCKIAHMDLKPQNLVVDEYLNIKIIDFSISINYKKITKKTIILPIFGTNFYMSTEVLRGDKINVKDLNKVDLYSLGVILYNMAFGCYPYGLKRGMERQYDEILKNIEEQKLEFEESFKYSPLFLDFLSKLLKKNIDERISLHEALNHPWIKGANLLMQEKDNISNIGIFLTYLITDYFKSFNDYIFGK